MVCTLLSNQISIQMKNQLSNLSRKEPMQVSVWLILEITVVVLIVAAFLDGLTAMMLNYVDPYIQEALPISAYAYMVTFAIMEIGALLILFVRPKRRSNKLNSNLSLFA
jgi:hypothetical protein